MADLLKQSEAAPEDYPEIEGDHVVDVAKDAAWIWQRIEGYTSHRFTEREVVWIIDGCEGDEWLPPLGPVVSQTAEKWDGGAWVTATLPDGPMGLCITSDGQFRITAQVGAGPVPAAVLKAAKRLADYSVYQMPKNGDANLWANEVKKTSEFETDEFSRPSNWMANALRNSGAGDLLRNYRRFR